MLGLWLLLVPAERVERVGEEAAIAHKLSQEQQVVRESTGHVDDALRKSDQQEREAERRFAVEQREAERRDREREMGGVPGGMPVGGVTSVGHQEWRGVGSEKGMRKEEKQLEKGFRKEEKAAEKEEKREEKASKQVYKHGEKREEAEEKAREAALDAERARERLEGARMGHGTTGMGTQSAYGTTAMPGSTLVTPVEAGRVSPGIETLSPTGGMEGEREKGGLLGKVGLGGKSEAKEERKAEKELQKAEKREEKAERQAEKQVRGRG